MSIENSTQLENARRKLADLTAAYTETRAKTNSPEQVRELTLQSLKRRMNRLEEEIARFELGSTAGIST